MTSKATYGKLDQRVKKLEKENLILIFIEVITFALLRRQFSHCIRIPLLTGIVLVLVSVGFLTQTAAEGKEPERIVVAGGDSFEPLMFLNADGEPDGMYVDRWRLWSEKVGVEVDLRLMNWADAIPALLAGEVDAVDGVSYTSERAKFLDLSEPYNELPSYIYFHESIGGVRGLVGLEGFPVGVIGGSHVEDHLRSEAPKLRPVPYANYEEIVQAAVQDRLRVFVGEDPMIPFLFAKMGHRINFRRTEEPIISSDLRAAVRKGETELLILIDKGQKAITPAEWQKIRNKWAGVSLTSRIPWRWLIGGVVIFISGIALLLLWNTLLQKRVAKVTRTLSESEERLRSFGNALPDLAFILDEDGKYLEILTAEEQLLYKDLSDIKNYQLHEVLPKDVADLSLEMIGRTIATEKTQLFEYKLDLPTGEHWFEARLSPMLGIFRDKRMVTCISRDISERRKAEEELRESEGRFRTLFKFAPDAYYMSDLGGNFIDGNRKAEELIGYTREELIGRTFLELDLLPVEELQKATELLAKNMEGKPTGPDKFTLKNKDGRQVAVEIRTIPIDIGGQDVVLGIARDVSELKRTEEKQRRLEAQLQRSKKMEAIGTLAGGIAHDLNNVLSGIVSYPELILLDLPEDSKFRTPIEAIQESGHRATAIVQDLLTVAKGVAITRDPLNLNNIVGDYLKSPEFNKLKQSYPAAMVHTDLDMDLFNIAGSHVHIRKVVMNLVSNAMEAIEGSGKVTISTLNCYIDRPLRGYDDVTVGEYIIMSVSDDGSGISSNDLDRIFEPFYTKKVMGRSGTGLGLAVVWNTVQDHKGYIDVKSDENGTTFELYFPITRDEILSKDTSIPIEDFKGDGEAILVVDDVESQRDISCKMLEKLGYKTKSVSGGEEAVEYLKKHSADLILLDMIMEPGINGRETFERIIGIHPKQKAIILSGFAETDEVREAQKLGAGQYIRKPITLQKIGLAVKDELEK
jgi:PAS domain S-box-containing protein